MSAVFGTLFPHNIETRLWCVDGLVCEGVLVGTGARTGDAFGLIGCVDRVC